MFIQILLITTHAKSKTLIVFDDKMADMPINKKNLK